MNRILHVMHNEKFIAPFIYFIKENFKFDEHYFILVGGVDEQIAKIPNEKNVLYLDNSYLSKYSYFKLSKVLNKYVKEADKIMIHGLFSEVILLFLYFNQAILLKCWWVIWGGDLYVYNQTTKEIRDKIRHYIRMKIYQKMGHFISYIKGDYELAQKWYGAKGEYHECFMYPSNLYKEYDVQSKKHDTLNIQIGNSADPSNNHLEILGKLEKYRDNNIKIYAPLSYGNMEYAKNVADRGKDIFGEKFIAMLDFMPFEKYLEFLGEIDIAIFAHKRQQAMGNTITLLGLGKKVYMRRDITQWELFENIGVKIFDVSEIELEALNEDTKEKNNQKIKEYFSKENLKKQLKRLFNE